jgi:hypothetical protein
MMRLTIFIAITFLASCGDSTEDRKDGFSQTSKNPEDSLFQDVMDQHDEAMSKMGKLAGYRKQFDAKIDSLKKVKSAGKETVEDRYEEISGQLKQAEDRMNTWMEEFSIDSAQDNIERRIEYLEDEKNKVTRVKEEILSALAKADSALKK